jgi:leucyl-tRNA synthetase
MVDNFNPQEIEKKWQQRWADDKLYEVRDDDPRPKWYALTMFPYTSGDLHIGHWYNNVPADVHARYKRMRGFNVLHPYGFDAFGLPAENAAIRHGIHPFKWTMQSIERMRRQVKTIGAIYDWSREVITCLPDYYKWTEWFFLKLYETGLAYRAHAPVNWCPECQTVLANEQVVGEGVCERCETPVIRRDLEQWFFKITKYADELLDFEGIDWPEKIKIMQTNWIGKSYGTEISFALDHPGVEEKEIRVFTTRPDTVFGVTFMVLAPEHPLVAKLTSPEKKAEVEAYIMKSRRQSEIERLSTEKEKDGVFIGAYCVNHLNGVKVPIWIADYVLLSYGTGAVMAVPAHDERDFAFALKYGIPIIPVVAPPDGIARSFAFPSTMKEGFEEELKKGGFEYRPAEATGGWYVTMHGEAQAKKYIELVKEYLKMDKGWVEIVGSPWRFFFGGKNGEITTLDLDSIASDKEILKRCKNDEPNVRDCRTVVEMLNTLDFYRDRLYQAEFGKMIHSGVMTGKGPGIEPIAKYLEEKGWGKRTVSYKIRDWLISRQRYWGAPIPIVYCAKCGTVAVPEKDLPVLLPEDAAFKPTGESPLKYNEKFVNTTCPKCGGPARRETDTMDTFVCSSWYFLRYTSPHYEKAAFNLIKVKKWLPVDFYTGGAEHAILHLLYARFFIKAIRDIGLVDFGEPFLKLFNNGTILSGHQKMSKSRGNVANPDEYVAELGADAVRGYLMFIGPWDQGGEWDDSGISGMSRWLRRIWNLVLDGYQAKTSTGDTELARFTHRTIKKVTEDIEKIRFNTMVAAMMEFTNCLGKVKQEGNASEPAWDAAVKTLLLLLATTAPHLAEELWQRTGYDYSIHNQSWPEWDEVLVKQMEIVVPVQVNGKLRDTITMSAEEAASVKNDELPRLAREKSKRIAEYLEGKRIVKIIHVRGKIVNFIIK